MTDRPHDLRRRATETVARIDRTALLRGGAKRSEREDLEIASELADAEQESADREHERRGDCG